MVNHKTGRLISETTRFLLVLLWVYAAISKIIDFKNFAFQMKLQAFGSHAAIYVAYFLPCLELATAGLLFFKRTAPAGLYCSLLLLSVFTGYVALVVLHFFSSIPCTCGGILQKMGWKPHLVFNIFYLAVTMTAIILNQKKEVAASR